MRTLWLTLWLYTVLKVAVYEKDTIQLCPILKMGYSFMHSWRRLLGRSGFLYYAELCQGAVFFGADNKCKILMCCKENASNQLTVNTWLSLCMSWAKEQVFTSSSTSSIHGMNRWGHSPFAFVIFYFVYRVFIWDLLRCAKVKHTCSSIELSKLDSRLWCR